MQILAETRPTDPVWNSINNKDTEGSFLRVSEIKRSEYKKS